MAAKPVINMDVVIATAADLPLLKLRLGSLGYEHRGNLGVDDRERMMRINVQGTEDVLRAAGDAHVPRILYCSSVAALGNEEVEDQAEAVDRGGDVAGRDVVGAAFDRAGDLVRRDVFGDDLALVP